MNHFAKQRGFSLTEVAVATSVSSVLALGALAYAPRMLDEGQAQDVADEYAIAVTQIVKHFQPRPVSGLTLQMAAELGAFRNSQLTRDKDGAVVGVTSRFGSAARVDVAPAGWGVQYAGVPRAVCATLITSGAGALASAVLVAGEKTRGDSLNGDQLKGDRRLSWAELKLNTEGTGLDAPPDGYRIVKDLGRPVDVAALAGACGGVDSVGVVFLKR